MKADNNFWIAETPVTYELWYEVRAWAEGEDYSFANLGREGGDWLTGNIGGSPTGRRNEPVTTLNWYDSIVWCNALSEMLGYNPVYTIDGKVVKNAEELTDENAHKDVEQEDNDGFRLPTSNE